MYNESPYEEYMRSVLGYMPNNMYCSTDCCMMPESEDCARQNAECEMLYPDIYRRVYPLVCRECQNVSMPMTSQMLEQMTDNVLKVIEIELKIEVKNVRQEDRQQGRRNDFLRDLIQILILREIIGGGGFPIRPRPPRPPFPGPGPRPPFPGGPMRPREF